MRSSRSRPVFAGGVVAGAALVLGVVLGLRRCGHVEVKELRDTTRVTSARSDPATLEPSESSTSALSDRGSIGTRRSEPERIAAPETSDAGATLRVRTIRSDGTPVPFVTLTAIEIDDAVDEGSEELARLARRGFRFKGNSDRSGSGGLQVSARRRLAVRAVQCTDVTAAGFARARTLQRAGLRSREHPWRIELGRSP